MFTRIAIVLMVLVAVCLLVPLLFSAVKRGKERYEDMLCNHGEEHGLKVKEDTLKQFKESKYDPETDPVQQYDDGWYFWDEFSNRHGPFKTRKLAERALNEYIITTSSKG